MRDNILIYLSIIIASVITVIIVHYRLTFNSTLNLFFFPLLHRRIEHWLFQFLGIDMKLFFVAHLSPRQTVVLAEDFFRL